MTEIHPSAIIDPTARIGDGCQIGAFCEIGAFTEIGSGSEIQSHCSLGVVRNGGADDPLSIGLGAMIRTHTTIYGGSVIGSQLQTGHHVTIREASKVGDGVQFGTYADIQGSVSIGHYTKMHSSVFVPQNSLIEDYVWLFPRVTLTDDPHPPSETRRGIAIQSFAAVGASATIVPGVTIGRGTFVGAGSTVISDTGEDEIWVGNPARAKGPVSRIMHKETGLPAYPWRRHFHRGYPDAVVEKWKQEFPNG